ncbi:MAG: hypothetical protein NVSMB25_04790 [Thermoleophilaceae bacterium]
MTLPDGGGPALACPTCAARFGPEARFCESCGMPLVRAGGPLAEPPGDETRQRARKIRPELTRGALVRVAGARHQAEAELIQNILLEEGVPSVLRRSAGFDVPDFLAAGPRDVLIPQAGLEVARFALSQAEIEPAPETLGAAPTRGQVARLALALAAGTGIAALLAWLLVQVTG